MVDIRTIKDDTDPEILEIKFNLFELYIPKDEELWDILDIDDYLHRSRYCSQPNCALCCAVTAQGIMAGRGFAPLPKAI